MNSHGVVEVFLGRAHLDGDAESLRDFSRIRAEVVEADHAVAVGDVHDELAESCFLLVLF